MMPQPSSRQLETSESPFVATWRDRFLKIVLRGSCFLGLFAIGLYLLGPSARGVKFVAIGLYLVLVLVSFVNRLPYLARAGTFLFLLYASGLGSLLDQSVGAASILYLGFIVMAGLLLTPRASVYYAWGLVVLSVLPLLFVLPMGSASRLEAVSLALTLFLISFITAYGLRAWQDEFTRTHGAIREMLDALQSERSILEQRLAERTVGIDRKTEQLRATAYIARKTAEVQNLASLLEMVARLVTDQFGFYHTGIFLINETGDQAVLQAASSQGGQHMIERGHALSVGTQGIVGYVAAQKKPRVALDVGADAVFFNNPDLPRTRSELALPLLVRNRVLGVLDIQSDKPQAFNADDVDVLQTLADQVAIAIENARLLDETHATLVQLEALTSLRTREAWTQKLGERGRVFTYTPLGLRAEKPPENGENAVSASILLRGQKIGNISIARKGDAPWSKLDRDLVEEVANQVGLAIDNIRLLEEATNRARQEQIVGKLAARFSQSLDLDTLLQTAARELGQLPDVSEISVFVGQEAPTASPPKPRSKRNVS